MTKKNKGLKWNLSRRNGIKEPVKNIVEKSDSSVWTVNVAVAPGGSSSSLAVNKTGVLPASLQSFERVFWHEFLHKKRKW